MAVIETKLENGGSKRCSILTMIINTFSFDTVAIWIRCMLNTQYTIYAVACGAFSSGSGGSCSRRCTISTTQMRLWIEWGRVSNNWHIDRCITCTVWCLSALTWYLLLLSLLAVLLVVIRWLVVNVFRLFGCFISNYPVSKTKQEENLV